MINFSCQNQFNELKIKVDSRNVVNVETTSIEIAEGVSRKSDFLYFPDEKSFYQVLLVLAKKTPQEQSEWASQFGITSLRKVYDQVVKAEIDLFDVAAGDISKLDKNQVDRLKKYGFASEMALKNRDVIDYDKNTGFSMKIFSPHMSLVANRKGIVQVGKEIRKYADDGVRIILDGDESKIPLLDDIKESDESRGIRVEKAERIFSSGRVETNTRTLFCENIYYGNPQLKILTYDEFYVQGTVGTNTKFTHYQTTRNLRKGFLGYWYDYYTNTNTNGIVNYKDNTNTDITVWNGGAFYGGYYYVNPPVNVTMIQIYFLSDALINTSRTPITPYGQTLSNTGFVSCGSIY
ncbi:hypothetical protein [Thermoflexibacter ruber]|uniref:Uncharacterized protein n=1 Tax=Thermoflexibacter ruber TaxID=1003 RepID=A0A1I2KA79_9BACT|nr:hypothetical protein [Thermoflexibacter ruber]SFF63333.1 hypothetical protein SAMN04488541_10964 [Thermoflexibacter ruber]